MIEITKDNNRNMMNFIRAIEALPGYYKDSEDQLYIAFYNHKLLCVKKCDIKRGSTDFYKTEDDGKSYLYEVDNLIDFCTEWDKNDYERRGYNYRNRTASGYPYNQLHYNYTSRTNDPSKITFLPGTIEAFKKEYPYAPIDIFVKEAKQVATHQGYWGTGDENFALANFIGLYGKYPQLEMLIKSDLKNFAIDWMYNPQNDSYRKCFQNGKNLSEITTMPNWMWKKLIENKLGIDRWEFMRIWNKQLLSEAKKSAKEKAKENIIVKEKDIKGLDESMVEDILNLNIRDSNTLKKIKRIINNTFDENGKRLFSIKTLFNYLERVDMYQAIPAYEAIDIFADYVRMCKDMQVRPRTDSDSLKREHDVTARNHNVWMQMKRAEFEAEKGDLFAEKAEALKKYEYEDDTYKAICPKTIQDLIMEGCNNHNCVGSYVDAFARGTSKIFFIRHKDSPEKSYITIELTSTCNNYKQAYLGSNQRITAPKDWEFINKWLEHNEALNNS